MFFGFGNVWDAVSTHAQKLKYQHRFSRISPFLRDLSITPFSKIRVLSVGRPSQSTPRVTIPQKFGCRSEAQGSVDK